MIHFQNKMEIIIIRFNISINKPSKISNFCKFHGFIYEEKYKMLLIVSPS